MENFQTFQKKKQRRLKILLLVTFIVIAGVCFLIVKYSDNLVAWFETVQQEYFQKNETPPPAERLRSAENENQNTNPKSELNLVSEVPSRYNLEMEFHSQAPLLNWDEIHEDMCEESSILLTFNYYEGKSMTSQEFDEHLLDMKEKEEQLLGVWKSTSVGELKTFIEQAYPRYRVEIMDNITSEQIEQYIASNIPVLLPLSGQTIGNPFYNPPGPVYHMLVVKGYTPTHFITNDVGTKRGKDYFYKKETILNNIHDWDPNNIMNGANRGFVILPR